MAFQYIVSVNKNGTDCKQLLFVDETGNYSTTNPGGWGMLNKAEKQDTEESYVVITNPDTTTTTVDLYPLPYQFPQTNSTAYYISPTAFEDGVYQFVFTVVVDGNEYSYTTYYLSTCNIDCCMSNFAGKINPSCACNDKMLQKWADMQSYYNAMLYNFECGNYNETTNLLNKLTAMCSKNGCGCGC